MDNKLNVFTRLQKIVIDQLAVPENEVVEDSTWEQLGADSLDRIQLSLAIEEAFSIDIPHRVGERLNTVKDAADHIWSLMWRANGCPVSIERAITDRDWREICSVRNRVFGMEHGFKVDPLPGIGHCGVWHYLARDDEETVGTLSLVDTTGQCDVHKRYRLNFRENERVARYAQLAILESYRKRGIFRMLIEKAQSEVISNDGFDVAWLLYPATHAQASVLTQSLGFTVEAPVLRTEFGKCQVLMQRNRKGADTAPAPHAIRAVSVCAS